MKQMFVFIIFIVLLYIIYNIIIKQYFRKNNNVISYNILLYYIQNVSKNNYFMNYGLWDNNVNNLFDANKNLVNIVFNKSELINQKNLNILDVGCGYGEQDMEWVKHLDKSCKITAIDISEEQIYNAMKKNSNVNFEICDSSYIDLKYKNNLFDRIISVESAFHYPERKQFFKNVNKLLNDNGKFVITDIMLNNSSNDSVISKIFIYIFSDFLCIPKQNLITEDEWNKQISDELIIEENINITEETFKPYYAHFMTNYIKNNNLPDWLGNNLSLFFCSNQPFTYKIAVCSKKKDCTSLNNSM